MGLLKNLSTHEHVLQVTSFGGTGTTMLYQFLDEQSAPIPQDHDNWKPWKHLPKPPADNDVRRGFRAVYLFGNPMDAVLSVFRRDYQYWHVRNMNSGNDSLEGWDDDWSLEEFLAQGHDHFRMERHFLNWTQADRSYPILLLNFDALWERLPEVFAFLGLPTSSIDTFPEKRKRASDWTEESKRVRGHLQDLYGDLWSKIQDTPEFQIQ